MRFMVLVKASKASEAGELPSNELLAAMSKFNEELSKAGVLLDLNGLQATSRGARIRFDGDRRVVSDGPFPEARDLVAGYWMIQVRSREEAVEWMKRAPMLDGDELELRPIFELADFEMTPDVRATIDRVDRQVKHAGGGA